MPAKNKSAKNSKASTRVVNSEIFKQVYDSPHSFSSALTQVHTKELLVKVILGDKKFVNTEAPRAIADLFCFEYGAPIRDLRSFKCHNWAYAKLQLLGVLEQMKSKTR